MSLPRVLIAMGLGLCAGCVSVTPAGESVRITANAEVVHDCKFVGTVSATSGWGGSAGSGLGTANTEKALRNKAAKLGANVVHLTQAGVHSSGEAYSCSE